MADAPAADWPIDVHVVARLVADQHPECAGALRLVANGWDNAVFRLGHDLAVRVPRREQAVALIEHEQRWLPVLAPTLPLPVPTPVAAGAPTAEFPHPWSIVPWFPGFPAWEVAPALRGPLAEPLAGFLAALHAQRAPADAPRNPFRGVPLAERDATVRERIGALDDASRLAEVWADGVAAPAWDGPPVWVHGDVHPGNLIVVREEPPPAVGPGPVAARVALLPPVRLAAVVDWGDLAAGDPAVDLAVAWTGFESQVRRRFLDEYGRLGRLDDGMLRRARAWAAAMAASMIGMTSGSGNVAGVGRFALEQLRAD